MNHDFGLKQLLGAFVVCVAGYLLVFYGIEFMRNRKGPWEVDFVTQTNGPSIVIDQPMLNIHHVEILLSASITGTNLVTADTNIDFGQPRPVPFDVPFGQCVGLDTVTHPGTVDLKLNGHEIQLLPRVLTIDGHEYAWRSGAVYSLNP